MNTDVSPLQIQQDHAEPHIFANGPARLDRALADYAACDWTDQAIFLNERFEAARAELGHWQALSRTSRELPPLAGLTMTVKACFDTAGWVSSCGSRVLQHAKPAMRSAALVHKLRTAGATLLAQTNMTEFAYGALGVNTRFGTPRTPLDPTGTRIAGGSSSGAAVAVARGYGDVAVCSDTSGSARIPAAFCGVVGFKPSRARYDTQGMHWLSTSFDVPGLICPTVGLCRQVDRAITGCGADVPSPPLAIRLAVPGTLSDMGLDEDVHALFRTCRDVLTAAGITIHEIPLDSLMDSARIAAEGGIIGAEAYALHRHRLATDFDGYDPVVGKRLLAGRENPAYRYVDALQALSACRDRFDREITGYDGFLLPTVPILPPAVAELRDEATYLRLNRRAFSLTEFANRLDLPGISLPVGKFPVGLMLTGIRGGDDALLAMASVLEPLVSNLQQPV
ncbi:amidase [Komagataeibacter saccharivorans]|uniref:amidase n=1 Tax=Komagataeibacter saccharivorans TaxID=265959 RepID=UPI0024A7B677|nr:amidase family protein [Komagataeibacter saccharivorans]